MLDASDLRSLQYFWETKDDIERCTVWGDKQEEIAEKYPELVKAWNDFLVARTVVTAVLAHAVSRAEREE